MAKEGTVLMNVRIPKTLLEEFDKAIKTEVNFKTRTARLIYLMDKEIKKINKKS